MTISPVTYDASQDNSSGVVSVNSIEISPSVYDQSNRFILGREVKEDRVERVLKFKNFTFGLQLAFVFLTYTD